jgi:hypothetical protein
MKFLRNKKFKKKMITKYIGILIGSIASNIALYAFMYMLIGSRIDIEFNYNYMIILCLVCISSVFIIIGSKFLEKWIKWDYKKLTLTSFSTIFYSLFMINIFGIGKIIYNLLHFEDIILSTKYINIKFFIQRKN